MRAGNLDRVIELQAHTETVHPSGSVSKVWTTIATTRAELVQTSADEIATGYGEAQSDDLIFRIWWRPSFTTAERLIYAGAAYDIKRIVEIGRRRLLEIRAVAVS